MGDAQHILVVVINAQGSKSVSGLYDSLRQETGLYLFDPSLAEDDINFVYQGQVYCADLFPADSMRPCGALFELLVNRADHLNLIFTYDASSKASWDEIVASYEAVRRGCENNAIPFTTMLLAMGEGLVSRGEAFASQRGCRFAQYSPTNGRGLCGALASLVEDAYDAQAISPRDPASFRSAANSVAKAVSGLFHE
ncbi:hypothetical protein VTI74DRAFT_526 [Chaetomium olivicolor]